MTLRASTRRTTTCELARRSSPMPSNPCPRYPQADQGDGDVGLARHEHFETTKAFSAPAGIEDAPAGA